MGCVPSHIPDPHIIQDAEISQLIVIGRKSLVMTQSLLERSRELEILMKDMIATNKGNQIHLLHLRNNKEKAKPGKSLVNDYVNMARIQRYRSLNTLHENIEGASAKDE